MKRRQRPLMQLARIYELVQTNSVEGAANSDELEILSILVKEYELVHYSVAYPNPLEACYQV